MKENCSVSLVLLLSGCIVAQVVAGPEERMVDGVAYQILIAKPDSVRMVWKDRNGRQLRTFPEVTSYLESEGFRVETVMNGGIYEPGGIPSGLLIQEGRELRPVNRLDGFGNFFLKPNGIFLIGTKGAAVVRAEEFPLKDSEVSQAIQSGPLLLRSGKIHPRFLADSTSRLHRNGVGVSKGGEVVFVITDFHSPKFPNLFEFARLFQILGCEDALFLDGDLSQMVSGEGVKKLTGYFGAMIAVVAPQ